MTMSTPNGPRSQAGATLIEALVSIVIMSFGLIGVAGLQLASLTFQKSAWSTHRVAELTGNFAERVRANPKAGETDYQYTSAYATGKAATLPTLGCRTSGTCTPAQIAADDIAGLLQKAQTSLPQGSMQVTGTKSGGLVINLMYFDKDFVQSNGAPGRSQVCSASLTGVDWRNCCPTAEDGVRCRRFSITP